MPALSEADHARLLAFLHGRDAPCPLCGYNLRDMAEPRCPECGQALELTVGTPQVRFGWFLTMLAPSLFSGIAAVLMLIMLVIEITANPGPLPPMIWMVELFGVASGVAGVVLLRNRFRFLRLPKRAQVAWAAATWALHGLVFVGLVLFLVLFL